MSKVQSTGIHSTISPPLSGVMEDCFIVRVQQLQMLYCQRCCMSASQRMFGSLWNVVGTHEHPLHCTLGVKFGRPRGMLSCILQGSTQNCKQGKGSGQFLLDGNHKLDQ